jgi:hypothetical protein
MTKELSEAAKIAAGIQKHMDDETHGRRTVRWLAERSGISYSTLQGKLADVTRFNVGELFKIADAFGCQLPDLYDSDNPTQTVAVAA